MVREDKYFEAIRNKDVNLVRKLLEINPELVSSEILGDATLLNKQIWKNKTKVDILPNENRSSPALHYTVFHGLFDITKLLLEFGAKVNKLGYENNHEMTPPVVLAAWEGGDEILKLLLENGANPNLKSSNNVSALSIAKRHNKTETIKILMKYGATT